MEKNFDRFKKILLENDYRLTSQRKEILKVFLKHKEKHFNAEQLSDILKNRDSNIGLATIYRNLELFHRLGILKQLDFNDAFKYYELNLIEKHHHHLICINCNEIIEFNDKALIDFEKQIEKEYDFEIRDHIIKFYGVCKDCSQESE
ncbi:MAG: transcriptional repressor [Halanaerobiales bacterium]|nr:transcriptional repressor [Halanaerobiales bacterium]